MDTTRASLLLRIKDPADATAWRDFDAIYRPMLKRFATMRGLEHAAAEDVVQHCMVAVYEHIRGFEYDPKKGRFKGWLRTLVNNRVRNLHRNRHEDEARTQDFRRDQERELAPDEAFERVWMEEHLRHAMQLLRKEAGDAAYAAYTAYAIDGKPVEEVCKQFDLTANQLYKLKWRLTQRLSEMLKELLGDED
ncbi:MAG: hypothetical protein DCC65_01685 [Planctomycetota bacterium]|nr:MAG: hypothetical protein DCC65_01685 [Planctomycetota bacterium]